MLFRSESINAQKNKLCGNVFLTSPTSFSYLSTLIVSIIVLGVCVLITGSYARSEHVAGYLTPSRGMVKLQVSQFGTLESLHASEGQVVQQGQILASIIVSRNTQEGVTSAQKALQALDHQKALLKTQVTLEQNKADSELAGLLSEQKETLLRVTSLQGRILIQKQITVSAETAYTSVQDLLAQGYIAKIESERRRQTWLAQQAQEQLKTHELEEAKAKLEQISIRLSQIPNESKQRLSRLYTQQSELDARYAELEERHSYNITSPVNGKVVSISGSSIGRTVQSGQPLFSILPENSVLEAELFVPSRAAGFIEEGQEVRLLYDAFPYQRFGSFPATITKVTQSILAPNEILAPFELKEPVYRVKARVKSDEFFSRGKKIALQSGMTLKANIVLERRSFMDWLLEPLMAVGART